MKKYYIFLIALSFIKCVAKNDSLHFNLFVGANLNTYYSKGFKASSNPIGFKVGFCLSKEVKNNFLYSTNIWYQNTNYSDRKTNFYDSYYEENVNLISSAKFDQVCMSFEVQKKVKSFYVGVNAGFSYLLKSKTTQDVSGGTGITAQNIHNTYMIYDFQKDSYYNTINPFAGLSITYYPIKRLGIKYENNFSFLSEPFLNYQYFNLFHYFNNSISLTLKIR